ncbi:MAG: hypothetical protein QXL67_05235 [Candidatus Bathyarchaeia archaeon]
MKSIYCRRKVRGVSSAVGMLVVAGMLFTVVVPLFVYINTVNTLYNKTVYTMNKFDRERNLEKLSVVAYPTNEGRELNVYIYNGAAVVTEVERIWVTDIYNDTSKRYESKSILPPATESVVCGINVTDFGEVKLLNVKVVTRRGNLFSAINNPIYIASGSYVEPFNIQLCFHAKKESGAQFTRIVNVTYGGPDPTYQNWNSSFQFYQHMPQMNECYVYVSVGVPAIGVYYIRIYKESKQVYFGRVEVTPQVPVPWVLIPYAS